MHSVVVEKVILFRVGLGPYPSGVFPSLNKLMMGISCLKPFKINHKLRTMQEAIPSVASTMAEDRCFANPFPPYSEDAAKGIIDPVQGKLTQTYKTRLRESVLCLLGVLEKGLPQEVDWRDVSVYTGTSGYALLYLNLADILRDETYLQKAVPIVEKSLKSLRGRRLSFLCGDPGPLAVGAVLYHKLNMTRESRDCIERLNKLREEVLDIESGLPDELLYGRVGYLYALLLVQHKVGKETVDDRSIVAVVKAVLESGRGLAKKERRKVPLMYQWHDKNYLGAAHGVAGILFMLMQVRSFLTPSELDELVKPTVDFMCGLVFPSGNMPSSIGNGADRLVHWCHGAPGALFLFCQSFKVFSDPKYLTYARGCAEVIWQRGLLRKGYGLCHGAAGNAYALLYMYQVTKEREYLYKAAQFGVWCQEYGKHGCRTPDRPLSLFEGLAGNIHFLASLTEPERAKFPGFLL
ncbi:glutathione S-transferase LANCL1-like isoform X3 [Oratosquilla oratoria]|uniref:glutathione S-transferase LANCL1-like isoform X3 n=2 Tax=Oratosquilla oratoria TaxID=337810 RepID=UPI003F75B040